SADVVPDGGGPPGQDGVQVGAGLRHGRADGQRGFGAAAAAAAGGGSGGGAAQGVVQLLGEFGGDMAEFAPHGVSAGLTDDSAVPGLFRAEAAGRLAHGDRKSTRLNSSHV